MENQTIVRSGPVIKYPITIANDYVDENGNHVTNVRNIYETEITDYEVAKKIASHILKEFDGISIYKTEHNFWFGNAKEIFGLVIWKIAQDENLKQYFTLPHIIAICLRDIKSISLFISQMKSKDLKDGEKILEEHTQKWSKEDLRSQQMVEGIHASLLILLEKQNNPELFFELAPLEENKEINFKRIHNDVDTILNNHN